MRRVTNAFSRDSIEKFFFLPNSFGVVHRITGYNVVTRWGDYNLQTYLAENLNLEWKQKSSIARGIANGLNYIHQKDILHYDIKRYDSILTHFKMDCFQLLNIYSYFDLLATTFSWILIYDPSFMVSAL